MSSPRSCAIARLTMRQPSAWRVEQHSVDHVVLIDHPPRLTPLGEGARKIEAAVDAALAASPYILLIDAIAGRRDDETSGEGRKGA